MASLQGQQINLTYEGLIKTADNTATPPFPPVALQYGDGTSTPISLGDGTSVGVGQITLIEGTPGVAGGGTLEVNGNGVGIGKLTSIDNGGTTGTIWNGTYNFGQGFPGAPSTTVDFTNATVTGLPSAAGLENGTGTDSLQSAASLTTNPANAANLNTIALGDAAAATTDGGISIGQSTRAYGNASSVAIGDDADGHNGAVGIGDGAKAYYGSVAIGKGANSSFTTFGNVHIGEGAGNTTGGNGANVTIGVDATQSSNAEYGIAIGYNSEIAAHNTVVVGANTTATNAGDVVIGDGNTVAAKSSLEGDVVIGQNNSSSTVNGGENILIGKDNEVTQNE